MFNNLEGCIGWSMLINHWVALKIIEVKGKIVFHFQWNSCCRFPNKCNYAVLLRKCDENVANYKINIQFKHGWPKNVVTKKTNCSQGVLCQNSGKRKPWHLAGQVSPNLVPRAFSFKMAVGETPSLLAEAPFPLYSPSWRTGRKGTSAMGRNELCWACATVT